MEGVGGGLQELRVAGVKGGREARMVAAVDARRHVRVSHGSNSVHDLRCRWRVQVAGSRRQARVRCEALFRLSEHLAADAGSWLGVTVGRGTTAVFSNERRGEVSRQSG
jgi:hypothetical protein